MGQAGVGGKAWWLAGSSGAGVFQIPPLPKRKRLRGAGGWQAGVQGIAHPQMSPSSPSPASSQPDAQLLSSAAFGSCFSTCRVCEPA